MSDGQFAERRRGCPMHRRLDQIRDSLCNQHQRLATDSKLPSVFEAYAAGRPKNDPPSDDRDWRVDAVVAVDDQTCRIRLVREHDDVVESIPEHCVSCAHLDGSFAPTALAGGSVLAIGGEVPAPDCVSRILPPAPCCGYSLAPAAMQIHSTSKPIVPFFHPTSVHPVFPLDAIEPAPVWPVVVHLYDIDMTGWVKQVASPLLGTHLEGIWHTGVVVYGKEYFWGGQLLEAEPGLTGFGSPTSSIDLGNTEVYPLEFVEFLLEQREFFSKATYRLLHNNCNNFTNLCVKFLTGNELPEEIRDLAREALSSPVGSLLGLGFDQCERYIKRIALSNARVL